MRNLFLCTFLFISILSNAQISPKKRYDFGIVSGGIERGFNRTPDFTIKGKSNTFFGAFYLEQKLKKSFSIAEGLGIANRNYHTNLSYWKTGKPDSITFLNDTSFTKNKLTVTSLELPIELRFTSNPNSEDKSWKFAVGFSFGLNLSIAKKTNYLNGEIIKLKRTADLTDAIPFRLGATARAGYNNFGVISYYGLNPIFRTGTYTMNPFYLGAYLILN